MSMEWEVTGKWQCSNSDLPLQVCPVATEGLLFSHYFRIFKMKPFFQSQKQQAQVVVSANPDPEGPRGITRGISFGETDDGSTIFTWQGLFTLYVCGAAYSYLHTSRQKCLVANLHNLTPQRLEPRSTESPQFTNLGRWGFETSFSLHL